MCCCAKRGSTHTAIGSSATAAPRHGPDAAAGPHTDHAWRADEHRRYLSRDWFCRAKIDAIMAALLEQIEGRQAESHLMPHGRRRGGGTTIGSRPSHGSHESRRWSKAAREAAIGPGAALGRGNSPEKSLIMDPKWEIPVERKAHVQQQLGSKTLFGILAMILPMAGGLTGLSSAAELPPEIENPECLGINKAAYLRR